MSPCNIRAVERPVTRSVVLVSRLIRPTLVRLVFHFQRLGRHCAALRSASGPGRSAGNDALQNGSAVDSAGWNCLSQVGQRMIGTE